MVATTRDVPHLRPRARPWFLLIVLLPIIGVLLWAVIAHWPEQGGIELWTIVDDGDGLKKGMAVTLAGIPIGQLQRIELTEDDRVRVVLRIDRAHAHRMRAPVDEAACAIDEKACGTRVAREATPSLSLASQTGFMVYPAQSRGRALQTGDFVPSVPGPDFDAFLAALQDERIVRELPLEMRRLIPELHRFAESMTKLSESLQKRALVRGLFGGGGDQTKEDEKKARRATRSERQPSSSG